MHVAQALQLEPASVLGLEWVWVSELASVSVAIVV
jgi:hypothetical protein